LNNVQTKAWTNMEIQQLKVLSELGASTAYIAATLGRPVAAVLDKMHEIGISRGWREAIRETIE
jgi:hypothetical protein